MPMNTKWAIKHSPTRSERSDPTRADMTDTICTVCRALLCTRILPQLHCTQIIANLVKQRNRIARLAR